MKKLEQAVNDIDSQYRQTSGFKPITINDKAFSHITNGFSWLNTEAHIEEQRHLLATKRIDRQKQSLHAAAQVLLGSFGYLRCPQGWAQLQSGFTCFQEVTNRLLEPMVDVSIHKVTCGFGMEIWAIDDRGMMTLEEALRDSSD